MGMIHFMNWTHIYMTCNYYLQWINLYIGFRMLVGAFRITFKYWLLDRPILFRSYLMDWFGSRTQKWINHCRFQAITIEFPVLFTQYDKNHTHRCCLKIENIDKPNAVWPVSADKIPAFRMEIETIPNNKYKQWWLGSIRSNDSHNIECAGKLSRIMSNFRLSYRCGISVEWTQQ